MLTVLENGKFMIRVLVDQVSEKDLLPGLQVAIFLFHFSYGRAGGSRLSYIPSNKGANLKMRPALVT